MKQLIVIISFLTSSGKLLAQKSLNQQLITDFGQTEVKVSNTFEQCTEDGEQGNCAAIALVKTALAQFKSLNNIYKEFKAQGDSFYFRFNDDLEVSISRTDTGTVKQFSGISNISHSVYYDSAIIIYASICKRILSYKQNLHRGSDYNSPDCISSFRDAVDYIDSGYPTALIGEFLGFEMETLSLDNLRSEPAVIINDGPHAAYCSYGVQDILGSTFTISGNRMKNPRRGWFGKNTSKITSIYRLKK